MGCRQRAQEPNAFLANNALLLEICVVEAIEACCDGFWRESLYGFFQVLHCYLLRVSICELVEGDENPLLEFDHGEMGCWASGSACVGRPRLRLLRLDRGHSANKIQVSSVWAVFVTFAEICMGVDLKQISVFLEVCFAEFVSHYYLSRCSSSFEQTIRAE